MPTKLCECLALAAVATLSISALSQTQALGTDTTNSEAQITGIFVDVSQLHHDSKSNGDTWDYIWADNDIVYSFNCDGRGYGTSERNLSFNKLIGDVWNGLVGSSIDVTGYGKSAKKASNGSNWKATGADSIDGVIYAFIANNWYGSQGAFGGTELDSNIRQSVQDMSLIKSTDKGLTWTRDAETNYSSPMWTSRQFSTAFFIKYGRDGGNSKQDDKDKFVYAISNDGFWNCGSHFYLGKVPRGKIGNLKASDWQFFSGGDWTNDVDAATPLAGFPNGQMKDTMGSPLWIAALHKYVAVTWYDPGVSEKWHYPENVTFAFYQANHPWGPWTWIGEKSAGDFIADKKSRIHRWYGPSLSPKFIKTNVDGSVTAIMTVSGQTWEDEPQSLYKNNSVPVTFFTKPLPKEVQSFNDTEAKYSKGWKYEGGRGVGDFHDDVHATTVSKALVEFRFNGRGIEVLSEKNNGLGQIEVFLDGTSQGVVSLHQDPMPLLYQIELYRNMNLTSGSHSLRIVNESPNGTPVLIDGFRVYGEDDFDPQRSYLIVNHVTGDKLTVREGALTAESSSGDGWRHTGNFTRPVEVTIKSSMAQAARSWEPARSTVKLLSLIHPPSYMRPP